MSEWWERAYPGGPMVGPPLVRPLYPPDAAGQGKNPSPPGDDCLAIKRALWRGGRWQGPASRFDREWSNSIAHGSGPNVVDSGLAGFQRQMGIIPSSGWLGEYTMNAIRSARIPAPLPNAGEPLLDATAIGLLEKAASAHNRTSHRERALSKAIAQLGYVESPPGTNGTMYGAWYGMNYEPWCAMFVAWCYEAVGDSPTFAPGVRYAYVPYMVSDARAGRNGLSVVSSPAPGDLAAFDWERDSVHDHVGIFERGTPASFYCIEGNTSPANDSNGGQVMRRERSSSSVGIVFMRVAE